MVSPIVGDLQNRRDAARVEQPGCCVNKKACIRQHIGFASQTPEGFDE